MSSFLEKIEQLVRIGQLPATIGQILTKFYQSYAKAVANRGDKVEKYEAVLLQFIDLVLMQIQTPFFFELYHERIRAPIDYYRFGLDLLKPLVIFESSQCYGLEHLDQMVNYKKMGHNIILLANHQTEPDPQAISLLLDPNYSKFAEEIIFVAGHRVITDPLAVPFSMGRNLLSIFSKNYIDIDPALKPEKLQHNQRTMKKMAQLLAEGGKCIYVAPSGGRDRPNASGALEVARFDPQSIEMFMLMAQQAGTPTHFYPMALATYALLPPPNSIEKGIGEKRQAQCSPIHLAFGAEIDRDSYPHNPIADKKQRRRARADAIWEEVKRLYSQFK